MKLKSVRNTLLFFLSFIADFYTEFSPRNLYRFWYEMGGSDYQPQSFSQIVSRMIKREEIELKREKNKNTLKIKEKGIKEMERLIPLWRNRNWRWDKKWRLLIFDIEEKRRIIRDLLRKKIKELGFVLWQKSVYVSPFPVDKEINQYLKEKKLYSKAICFTAKKLGEEDDAQLAYHIFHLERLRKKYLEILKKIHQLKTQWEKEIINTPIFKRELKEIFNQYKMLMLEDPFLPEGLLPKDWEREKIRREIKDLFYLIQD